MLSTVPSHCSLGGKGLHMNARLCLTVLLGVVGGSSWSQLLPPLFGKVFCVNPPNSISHLYTKAVSNHGLDPPKDMAHRGGSLIILKARLTPCLLWEWHCLAWQTETSGAFQQPSSTHNVKYVKVYEQIAKSVEVPLWNQGMTPEFTISLTFHLHTWWTIHNVHSL